MELFAVFHDAHLLARGPLGEVLAETYERAKSAPHDFIFIQEGSGHTVDFDWRGSVDEVIARAQQQFSSGHARKGRPKLGVKSREVTLLPRHWSWLDAQSGSRSAVLRRLLDKEMQGSTAPNIDAIYGAMSTLSGDRNNFEEATRALFARDWTSFSQCISDWPEDLVRYFKTRVGCTDPGSEPCPSSSKANLDPQP